MSKRINYSFNLGATLDATFHGSMAQAKGQVKGLGQVIRDMESAPVGKLGARLESQRKKIKGLGQEYKSAREALAKLEEKKKSAGSASASLARKIELAQKNVNELSRTLARNGSSYRAEIASIRRTGTTVRGLSQDYKRLKADIDTVKKHRERMQKFSASGDAEKQRRSDLRGKMLETAAAGATLMLPTKLAISAEDTFADLKKVLPDMDQGALDQLFSDALAMSHKTGKSFEDVVAIMTAGAQAGLGKTREEMLAVTEQSLRMAVAWGVPAEEAGKSLATWQASMKLTHKESVHLADVINTLSDNMNAEAGEINRIVTRMGPLLKETGFGTEGIAAYAAAFKAAGADVEVCGTALKNMTKVIAAGSGGLTKERKGIYAQLGLNPDTLAKQMQEDAESATLLVLERLRRVKPEERMGLATRLFGDESIAAIAPLLGNIDALKEALVVSRGNVDASVFKEYTNRMSTAASAGQRFTANLRALGIEIGNKLLPATSRFFGFLDRGVSGVRGLASTFPGVTSAVVVGAGALVGLSAAGLVGSYVFSGLKSAWTAGEWALAKLSVSQHRATAAQRLHTLATMSWKGAGRGLLNGVKGAHDGLFRLAVALRTGTLWQTIFGAASSKLPGPIGLAKGAMKGLGAAVRFAMGPVGIAITVLGIAAGYIMEHWDTFGPYFKAMWDGVVGAFQGAWNVIKRIWDGIKGLAQDTIDLIKKIPGAESAIQYVSETEIEDVPVVGDAVKGWKKGSTWIGEKWNGLWGNAPEEKPQGAAQRAGGKRPGPTATASSDKARPAQRPSSGSTRDVATATAPRKTQADAATAQLQDLAGGLGSLSAGGGMATFAGGNTSVSVGMDFTVSGLDGREFRRQMEANRDDIAKIVSRVVGDMQHQRDRTNYGR